MIKRLEGHPSDADQFIYVTAGNAGLTIDGRRYALHPGMLAVIPLKTQFVLSTSGQPIDALLVRVNQADSSP